MEYFKIEGHSNLLRDPKTNCIVNTNMSDYQQYISRRNMKSEENKKVEDIEKDINNLKDDLNEIKFLLRSLINEPR